MKITSMIVLLLASAVSAQSDRRGTQGKLMAQGRDTSDDNEPDVCKELSMAMDVACSSEAAEDIIGDCMDECMDDIVMDGKDEELPACDDLKIIATTCTNQCASGDICKNTIMTALGCLLVADGQCHEEVFAVAPTGVTITSDTNGNLRSITNKVLKMADDQDGLEVTEELRRSCKKLGGSCNGWPNGGCCFGSACIKKKCRGFNVEEKSKSITNKVLKMADDQDGLEVTEERRGSCRRKGASCSGWPNGGCCFGRACIANKCRSPWLGGEE